MSNPKIKTRAELTPEEAERYAKIDNFMSDSEDLPDGAFWALAEEREIEASDPEWSVPYTYPNPKDAPKGYVPKVKKC